LIAVANSRRAQESLRVLESWRNCLSWLTVSTPICSKNPLRAVFLEQKLVGRLLRQDKARLVRGLYVIIDTGVLQDRNPLEIARQVIQAESRLFSFAPRQPTRNKSCRPPGNSRSFVAPAVCFLL
jgi:hypothetical protein